ncbi:MAG: acetolactate synthase [Pedosphaera sp.]|nr:acetolactate synthase [Pedosphaera sp.]
MQAAHECGLLSIMMGTHAIPARTPDVVKQFSVFTANRLGRLHELISLLSSHQVHVLALTVMDTTDSAIIRLATDDPEQTRELLHANGFPYTESELLVVEVDSATELNKLVAAMLEAEININYLYSFIPHPRGKSIIALSMEDREMAETVLQRHQFRVLRQNDISR